MESRMKKDKHRSANPESHMQHKPVSQRTPAAGDLQMLAHRIEQHQQHHHAADQTEVITEAGTGLIIQLVLRCLEINPDRQQGQYGGGKPDNACADTHTALGITRSPEYLDLDRMILHAPIDAWGTISRAPIDDYGTIARSCYSVFITRKLRCHTHSL